MLFKVFRSLRHAMGRPVRGRGDRYEASRPDATLDDVAYFGPTQDQHQVETGDLFVGRAPDVPHVKRNVRKPRMKARQRGT